MDVTKIIYYVEDEETPYLIKIPLPPGQVRLKNFKDVLPKTLVHGKFYFKSFDEDVGVVKEEIADDEAQLPAFNQRVVSWVVQAGGQQLSLLNKNEQPGCSGADSMPHLAITEDDTKKSKTKTEDDTKKSTAKTEDDTKKSTAKTEDVVRSDKVTSVVKPEASDRDPRKVMRRKQPNGSPQEFKVLAVSDATETASVKDTKPVKFPKSPSTQTDSINSNTEGNKQNCNSLQKQESKHVTWSDKNRDSKPVGSEKKQEAKSAVITEKKQELKPSEASEKKQEPKPLLPSKDTQPVGCSEKKQDTKPSKRPQSDPKPRSPRGTDTKSTVKIDKPPGEPEVTKGLSTAGNQGAPGLLKRLLAISNMKIPQSECTSSSRDSSQVHFETKKSKSNAYREKGSRHEKVTSNKSKYPNISNDESKIANELDMLFEGDWDIIETESTPSRRKSGSNNSAPDSHNNNARKTSIDKAKINNDNYVGKAATVKETTLAGYLGLDSTVSSTVDETYGRSSSQLVDVAPPTHSTRISSTVIPNVLGPPYCWGWSLPLPSSRSSPLSTAIETATSAASSLQNAALGIVNGSEADLGQGKQNDLAQSPQSQIHMDISLHSRLTVSSVSSNLSDSRTAATKRKDSPEDTEGQVPSKKMRRYYDGNAITLAA